jgi:hypothetical protein
MRPFFRSIIVAGLVVALCGCLPRRSVVRDDQGDEVLPKGEPGQLFTPSSYIARPTVGLGSKYRDLLSPESYIIWFSDEVAELKAEAAVEEGGMPQDSEELLTIAKTLNEKFIILEFHIVSAFSDSSIAYDITSFRHADVFLVDAAGNKYEPLQVIIGALERGQKSALMVFRRVNLLVFPRHDLLTGEPVITSDAGEVSLVLSGNNTTYFFSWGDVAGPPPQPDAEPSVQSVRAMTLEGLESALHWMAENLQ